MRIMSEFEVRKKKAGFTMKLWRGERMCLLGFDVDDPEGDFVGFAIECKGPGETGFTPLDNRLAFAYPSNAGVTGDRLFPSLEAPFQKFRWLHFPRDVKKGIYTYRATKMHMKTDGKLKPGTSITLAISLDPVTYHRFVDLGFTRGFASSQAFRDKLGNPANINAAGAAIIPSGEEGLDFQKVANPPGIYKWMGFEAYDLLFGFLDDAIRDVKNGKNVTVDMFAYDFNEPGILERLEALKGRVRVIVDDSTTTKKGVTRGHGVAESPESIAAGRLGVSAGAAKVKRTHFKGLQHNKVFIARLNGKPTRVLAGSTNFTYRGMYIQANNVLVFEDDEIAGLFGKYFDEAFRDPDNFSANSLATKWHLVSKPNKPPVHLCFSPHTSTDLSLRPVQGAIAQATSSVFYAVAFLYQMGPGLTKDEFDALMDRPIFSYGVSDKKGDLELKKPDGTRGVVDFAYLAAHAPEPFKREWGGGAGINIHHKFVVTDFNLPTAKVFTGSSNLSPSGEKNNGDHLILIEDRRIATAFALEALRMFDHLHFRTNMQAAETAAPGVADLANVLKLRKPKSMTGEPRNWWESSYVPNSQREQDRLLFSSES
jgi:phosphatidylserine/phosphatidylglycerophosphate/cardiolipin synthase-like enzyme